MSDDPTKEPTRSFMKRLTSLLNREPKTREQLMDILRGAGERAILSADMLMMVERILHVADMQVREVIVPKTQMVTVKKNSSIQDILPVIIESGHSRFPIIDINDDEIVGMLLAKDILKCAFQEDMSKLKVVDFLRPAIFTPQSKRIDILLREFRVNRNHIAIVIDEYGHVAGLVTIEDVLEQIVGDIEDEYDIDEDAGQIKKTDRNTYILKAAILIEDFNEYFKSEFSDDEFDTIGGLVLKEFGHMPKRGESAKIGNFKFKVLHGDNRRLYLLEVKAPKKKSAG